MCDVRPGPRCASETCENANKTYLAYQESHPAGPNVDPLKPAETAHAVSYAPTEQVRRITADEAKRLADARANSIEYAELLATRDVLHEDLKNARERLAEAKQNNDGARIVALNAKARDAYFDTIGVDADVARFRDDTATMLANIDPDTVYQSTQNHPALGDAKLVTDGDGVDRELARYNGLTGTDAAAVLAGTSDDRRVLTERKSEPLPLSDDPEFALTAGADGQAIHKSRPWEMVTAAKFADEHPEYNLARCTGTYQNPSEPWQVSSPRILLTDPTTGQPTGLLITQTAVATGDEWKDGIPVSVRAKALHDLNVTGLPHAHVAVLVDGKAYRSYRINANEVIDPADDKARTYADRAPDLAKAWKTIEDRRTTPHVPRRQKYAFKGSDSDLSQLAAYRGESVAQTERRLQAVLAGLDDGTPPPKLAKERQALEAKRVDQAYRTLLANADPSKTRYAFVDLETTSFTPDRGEILEVGIEVRDGNGRVVNSYQEVFSVDERFSNRYGTGSYGTHGISLEETRGKRSFAEARRDIARVLGIGTNEPVTVVAHNSLFERQWLDANLPGFHASRQQPADRSARPQVHELDTKWLSERAVHSNDFNTLDSFASRFGVSTEGAHRAPADVAATANALGEFRREFTRSNGARL